VLKNDRLISADNLSKSFLRVAISGMNFPNSGVHFLVDDADFLVSREPSVRDGRDLARREVQGSVHEITIGSQTNILTEVHTVVRAAIISISSLNHKDRTGLSSNRLIGGSHSVGFVMSLDFITGVTNESSTSSSISHHNMVSHLEVTVFTEGERSLRIGMSELGLSLVDNKLVSVLLGHVVLDLGFVGLFVFVPVSNASFGVELRAT